MFVTAPQTITIFGVTPVEAMIIFTVTTITAGLLTGLAREFMGLALTLGLLGSLLSSAAGM